MAYQTALTIESVIKDIDAKKYLLLAKEAFGKKTIRTVKTSDAKLFLIKLQQEDGKSYSSIHIIRMAFTKIRRKKQRN